MSNPYDGFGRKTPGQVAKAGGYIELAYVLIFLMIFFSIYQPYLPWPSFVVPAIFVLLGVGGVMFFGYAILSGMPDYLYAGIAIALGAVLFVPSLLNNTLWAVLLAPQLFVQYFAAFLASPGIMYLLLILVFVMALRYSRDVY